jgi:hypothetical protein
LEDKALPYPDVSYWVRQFRMGRESVEYWRRSGSSPDFQIHLRIDETLETWPNFKFKTLLSLPALLGQRYSLPLLMFFVWNFLTGDASGTKMSDDQKRRKVQLAFSLQGELERAQRRNERSSTLVISAGYYKKFPKGYSLTLDEELPERVRQIIGAEKPMLTVFSIRTTSLLWIFCHQGIVSLHNTSLIRY